MRRRDPSELLAAATAGNRAALARLLSLVEEGGAVAREVDRLVHPLAGSAHTVGITGAPGAGKSTLTDRMVASIRAQSTEVAVLAIDPSSPFSGGAILGDRVRMGDHFLDPGVFIRSMATRGALGGLAGAAPGAVRVLDAVGFPWILLETVGVGQVEVDIAGTADTTLVVLNPGWGDAVQASKAGLIEIADVFVINKADRPGAAQTEADLLSILEMSPEAADGWHPPVVQTSASTGAGVDALWAAVEAHRAHLERSGELQRKRARRDDRELREVVARLLAERAGDVCSGPSYDRVRAEVSARSLDPRSAAEQLLG